MIGWVVYVCLSYVIIITIG